jgi:hypothetical protein
MAYDFNSQDRQFDIPNPYRIENLFYFAASTVLFIGAATLLISSRHALDGSATMAALPMLIGLGMLIHGIAMASKAMSRMRFFFGRGQPRSLAPNLAPDQTGSSEEADALKEHLRHSSLAFKEPKGPLNGVLYSLIPNLIFAPPYIQAVAQRQFQNALAFGVTLLSLLVCMMGASHESSSWLGLLYLALTVGILIKPVERGAQGATSIGIPGLIILILFSVLGPVMVSLITKGITYPAWLPGPAQTVSVMLCGIAAIGLFFLAVLSQCKTTPPQATASVVQDTVRMNSHPKQLMDELERRMQDLWVASLPNRVYSRELPNVPPNAASGSFRGELIQETQPVPRGELADMTVKSCFAEPRFRWLAWLNVFGLGTQLAAVVSLAIFGTRFFDGAVVDLTYFTAATLGAAFWMLSNFCFRAGGLLWGRFDFVSKLIWVEMIGNFQAAKMDYGNKFTDRIKTRKEFINIESMTLRVWTVELATVAFGKDESRNVIAMHGLKDEAAGLHRILKEFAAEQSMIVAPTSSADLQRAQALVSMNRIGGPPTMPMPNAIAALAELFGGDNSKMG